MPEKLAHLAQRVSTKVKELESALDALEGRDTAELRRITGEIDALLSQQAALQASLEQRVENRVADRTQELSALSAYLQTHYEREKASLARELHDSLGGILTPVKMDLAWMEARLGNDPQYTDRMRRLNTLIDQGIDLKRRIIENLRPSLLDHLGLASALSWYVDETCRDAKIECGLRISERLERMPPDLEIALYRVVQEAVGNVVKHAQAKRLDLTVERKADGLRLCVADDGVGIADLAGARRSSHGFAGMSHRVHSVNGTFDVKSRPGKGTTIEVFVPLAKAAVAARG